MPPRTSWTSSCRELPAIFTTLRSASITWRPTCATANFADIADSVRRLGQERPLALFGGADARGLCPDPVPQERPERRGRWRRRPIPRGLDHGIRQYPANPGNLYRPDRAGDHPGPQGRPAGARRDLGKGDARPDRHGDDPAGRHAADPCLGHPAAGRGHGADRQRRRSDGGGADRRRRDLRDRHGAGAHRLEPGQCRVAGS